MFLISIRLSINDVGFSCIKCVHKTVIIQDGRINYLRVSSSWSMHSLSVLKEWMSKVKSLTWVIISFNSILKETWFLISAYLFLCVFFHIMISVLIHKGKDII